ncbi:hypothetical protein GCM10022198_01410 [Klugiella xanthotipulae]|uniref:Uncharacterized protein DUF4190 n=1 Tax=Klugiella xanthotipulae TaxID=244735 RepID=A0A543I540_9MICO|nr:DUF4190 domain-containing protein [Klugiella xanthotipulae]TQM65722.1 uncharacterized protein DUF4190 [Klugiella xanthotipulae]
MTIQPPPGPTAGYRAPSPTQPGYGQQHYPQPQYGQPGYGAPGQGPQHYPTQPLVGSYYPQFAQPRTNVLAIVTLCAAFFLPLAGIVTGHIALRQLRTSGEGGQGLAVAGLIISYVFTGIITLVILFYLLGLLLWGGFLLALLGTTATV